MDYAPTFCKLLYDSDFLTDEFFMIWHKERTVEGWVAPLDATSCLNDTEAEQIMNKNLKDFVNWLQQQQPENDYDCEDEYYDEEEAPDTDEDSPLI